MPKTSPHPCRRPYPSPMGRRIVRRTEVNECRRCASFCDRVIAPATCVAAACPNLYTYDDASSGRRFMGCIQGVFTSEIDVELFREAERTRPGFGSVRMAREPLARCGFSVEQAFASDGGDAYRCVNRRFFDWPDAAPEAVRAFDLRDRL
jgi:hypothetical protein